MTDQTIRLLRWLATHDVPRRVVLLCSDSPVPEVGRRGVAVRAPGCLVDASIGLPAQLLACGVEEVAVVPCPGKAAAVEAKVAEWRQTIASGLELWTDPPRPKRWRKSPEVLRLDAMPVSRRGLLGLGSIEGFPLDLEADETARTLAALDLLSERGQAVGDAPEDSPARDLFVVDCTACGVCVQACPHDALTLVHEGPVSILSHQRDACRGELECVRLCPLEAIVDEGPIPFAELVSEPSRDLITVQTTTCPRCGARHVGRSGSLCPTCDFRTANPFGSRMPPGLLPRANPTDGPGKGA